MDVRIEEVVKALPPEIQDQVRDFIEFLLEKRIPKSKAKLKLDWRGALHGLQHQYTSVELQHKALEWWENDRPCQSGEKNERDNRHYL